MDEGDEGDMLFSPEELEGSKDMQPDFDKVQIKSSYDQLFEEFNSLIEQLKDDTPKSKEKIIQLINKAKTILTQLNRVTTQLITDRVINQEDVQPIVLKIMEKKIFWTTQFLN